MLFILKRTWMWAQRSENNIRTSKTERRNEMLDIILGIFFFSSLDHSQVTSNFAITEKGFCVFKHLINKQKSWVKIEWVGLKNRWKMKMCARHKNQIIRKQAITKPKYIQSRYFHLILIGLEFERGDFIWDEWRKTQAHSHTEREYTRKLGWPSKVCEHRAQKEWRFV